MVPGHPVYGTGIGLWSWLQVTLCMKLCCDTTDPNTCCAADASVLCFVQWTDNLTSHFQDNRNGMSNRTLVSSQFLGGSSGILRFFPGGWRN